MAPDFPDRSVFAHGTQQHPPFERSAAARSRIFTALRFLPAPKIIMVALRSDNLPHGYLAAFVLDLDGNNIEAVFRES